MKRITTLTPWLVTALLLMVLRMIVLYTMFTQIDSFLLAHPDAAFQTHIHNLFTVMLITGVLLLALLVTYLVRYKAQQKRILTAEQTRGCQSLCDQLFYTHALLESHVDAHIITTPTGIISDVNKQMEMLSGYSRRELIGTHFTQYFTSPKKAEMAISKTLLENHLSHYELTARAQDGSETEVAYHAHTFYTRNHELQGVFISTRDITERKLLDRVLEESWLSLKAAKLVAEQANFAKSNFLASMSHELRTPLSAILGFAQLIEAGSPAPTAIQQRNLTHILQAGWKLLDLINEILDFTLIETGKLSLHMEDVLLADVINECETTLEHYAQQRGINISLPHFAMLHSVHADPVRLKEVLINLLTNAIQYNKEGGGVLLTCKKTPQERLRISIEDNGHGLQPEQIAQLFQPFNRLETLTTEAGIGISLIASKRLIELMGGAIGVESTLGKGSVFWIELNLSSKAVNIPQPISFIPPTLSNTPALYTLLHVEDNPANVMLVEDLMAQQPSINLLTARNGEHGVALARSAKPHVILMDINLPGINGIEALALLRNDPSTAHIPVVAISASAMPCDVEKGLQAGFYRYLIKPFRVDELMQTLEVALKFANTTVSSPFDAM